MNELQKKYIDYLHALRIVHEHTILECTNGWIYQRERDCGLIQVIESESNELNKEDFQEKVGPVLGKDILSDLSLITDNIPDDMPRPCHLIGYRLEVTAEPIFKSEYYVE